ncbi:hypothetical protein L249_5012 [Ophiocordyceps polyrhachis-furcata BCC 54312]|uniref:GST N-terminal domain-containing protein n=1 Tax=Ophiocordyceps polyrhachis-furcata BCC 54312 TaxID=1330021 RepID=A0A367L444_9HYPO|nr:hypothetical protein L249_5012 [Ophiocordyceps polyrhachis-furcata BCC 54312]
MATVDVSLAKAPSGPAAKLAAEHASDDSLKLYGAWFCPFVQRVWITLCEKKIHHQYVEINPYDKDPAFLALNPRGLVPTLAVPGEDQPLFESIIVCEYLDAAFPRYGPSLLPADPYYRARARVWIDHVGSRIAPAFQKLMQHTPDKPYSLDDARAELRRHVEAFVRQMHPHGPWFLADGFSLVDISLAPWARRMWLADECKPGGLGLPAEGEVWDRWAVWKKAVDERESVRMTSSSDESYLALYKR